MRIASSFIAITLAATLMWTGCSGGSSGDPAGSAGSAGTAANGGEGQGLAGTDGSNAGSGDSSSSGAGNAPGTSCLGVGDACLDGSECCSGACDTNSGCVADLTLCADAGGSCSAGTECCSLSCVAGKCSVDQCVSDGQACTDNDVCCSGSCGDDQTCTALNASCKTGGNECADNGDCCSGLCDDSKHCQLNSSTCTQPGDSCSRDNDCCTADCTIADGHTLGTCAPPPSGNAYCDKVDGMLCNGCGDCCSRLCAPGPSGIDICQPASGCHVTGDLCKQDTDCCGGDATSGLPGAGNGKCQIEVGAKVGICSNPINGGGGACNPEGNICHYKDDDYACNSSSARSDCCGPETPKALMCKLDALGVPRCLGIGDQCHERGDVCASAADCCDNLPCVPDENGALHCLDAGACVPTSGSCTINGDCCPGGLCHREPGSSVGSCTSTASPPTGSGGGSNGGASNGGGGTGGSGTAGAPTVNVCSEYGQICSQDGDCCNGIPCTSGICAAVVK